MTLLPKKGNLSSLKNWRPISLINTDAKVFTRLLNARLMPYFTKCISSNQLGFIPGRFIADHGLTVNSIKMIAHHHRSSSIGLLLDQEKAYDRIHPKYLRHVLDAFNVPPGISLCIISLFFSTDISVNVNGHITSSPILQHRGLRQGDPLSPLLFNIAFDPFVRSISQNSAFSGFHLPTEVRSSLSVDDIIEDLAGLFEGIHITSTVEDLVVSFSRLLPFHDTPENDVSSPPPDTDRVAILEYADDTLVFLRDESDFAIFQQAITTYMNASNAHLNYDKTEAFSLSGSPLPNWQAFLSSKNITSWHDRSSPAPIRYLGYPLCSSVTQRNVAFSCITDTIRQSCFLHSQRQLSPRGRATVLNSLIYSKLWHVLRLSTFTKSQMSVIRGIGSSFINHRIFPKLAVTLLRAPRSQGGLALLDLVDQQLALKWRWLYSLLRSDTSSTSTSVALRTLRFVFSHFLSSANFPSYQTYLLFPESRQSRWFPNQFPRHGYFLNVTNNFVKAVDNIPRSYTHCSVNAFTCLSLPFLSVVDQSLSPESSSLSFVPISTLLIRHPGLRNLLVRDVFTYDYGRQVIGTRDSTNPSPNHRNLSLLAMSLIQQGQLVLLPFFSAHTEMGRTTIIDNILDLQPFCLSIVTPSVPLSSGHLANSIRYYKYLVPQNSNTVSPLSASAWRRFWSYSIPLHARTVWFRGIHNKIPCRQLLHTIMPSVVDSSICSICSSSTAEDTVSHFLFSCPLKLAVWRSVFNMYIADVSRLPSAEFVVLMQSILLFSCPYLRVRTTLLPELSTHQIFACCLLCIWRSHWNFVFHSRPFQPGVIISSVSKLMYTLVAESDLDEE